MKQLMIKLAGGGAMAAAVMLATSAGASAASPSQTNNQANSNEVYQVVSNYGEAHGKVAIVTNVGVNVAVINNINVNTQKLDSNVWINKKHDMKNW